MLKDFEKTLSSYNDHRLSNISWFMLSDPTEDGVLGYFDKNDLDEKGAANLVQIPLHAPILGTFRPKNNRKLVKAPIGVAGIGLAQDCPQDNYYAYLVCPLRVASPDGQFVTLLDFFKAIYDFYHLLVSEEEYKKLINLKKQKERELYIDELKLLRKDRKLGVGGIKYLREHWAGSMYFEGYNARLRMIEYGT